LFYLVEYAATPQLMAAPNCSLQAAPGCCNQAPPRSAHQSASDSAQQSAPGCCHQTTQSRSHQPPPSRSHNASPVCAHQSMDPGAKGQCPKPFKGCNPATSCCLNCPLCYVTVLPLAPEKSQEQRITTEYNVWSASYVYLYHTSCWKPPNQA